MLALTYQGKGRVRVDSKREPALEHPNDVILKVTRAAICSFHRTPHEGDCHE